LLDADGQIVAMVSVARHITECRKREEETEPPGSPIARVKFAVIPGG
jgi:hypothetical protein